MKRLLLTPKVLTPKALTCVALSCVALSCAAPEPALRVGAKGFTEQTILVEMVSALARQAGVHVAPVVTCGDTHRCHRLLRKGEIDLLVEYTGTGLTFIGAAPGQTGLADLRALYAPIGLRWLGALGFDNGYRVVVRPGHGAKTIADLAESAQVRLVAPPEYARRPGDGLAALVARYGLRMGPRPLFIDAPRDRYGALLEGRADAAIGYATDAEIEELGLRVLDDPAGFFLPYEGVILVRDAALTNHPKLAPALARLEGRIDTAQMRGLNGAVRVKGREAAAVAREFLVEAKLLDATQAPDPKPPVRIALRGDEGLDSFAATARRATRAAFPDRPVSVLETSDPVGSVAGGAARLTVVGAEAFFRPSLRSLGKRTVRETRIEAVAALGRRMLHVVRRADDDSEALAGRLGVPPKGTGGARVATLVLRQLGDRPGQHANAASLLKAVRFKDLDGALILASAGDPHITQAFEAGGLKLVPLTGWLTAERALAAPYLRPARVPPGTYAGQAAAVETLASQVVLADAAPATELARGGGPAAALASGGIPLSAGEVEAAVKAAGVAEAPDPVLPSAWGERDARPVPTPSQGEKALEAILNLLAVLFTGWLVVITLRPTRHEERT
jgi:glycine betaine/choline ABC-type transport system substrate-binding protein